MLKKILSVLNRDRAYSIGNILESKAFKDLRASFEEYDNAVNIHIAENISMPELQQPCSNAEVIEHLEKWFELVAKGLTLSKTDAQALEQWSSDLRELMVNVHYTGDYIETANGIKQDLDERRDIIQSSQQAKKLLIQFSNNITEDHDAMQGYLVTIAEKLQTIYSEFNQTQHDYFSRKSMTGSINQSFERGIRDISESIAHGSDINELKNNLNHIVTAIQTKIIREVEADEHETRMLEEKISGMSHKIKALEEHAKHLEETIHQKHKEAITDPLTGLYNRAAYVQALEQACLKWENDKVPATMLVWDIDYFKSVNDRYGHAAGDKVLQSVAKKLSTGVRKGDILARFGGEEFVMLLANKTLDEGLQLAERIRLLISSTEFTYKKQPLHVTISCGVSSFVENDTPTMIFERADKALYRAKQGGRDRVEIANVA